MNEFFDMLELIPVQAAYAYGMTQILPMRRKRLFWMLELTLWPLAQIFPTNIVGLVVGIAAQVISWLVLPLLLFKAKPALKALVALAALACMVASEMVMGVLWGVAWGGAIPEDYALFSEMQRSNWLLYALIELVRVAALLALLMAVRLVVQRKSFGQASGWVFAVLAGTQMPFFVLLFMAFALADMNVVWAVVSLFLVLLCLVVDAVLLALMARHERRRLDERRAALLQAQLADYLGSYGIVTEQLGRVARMRHDLRNQLQVVDSLVRCGKREEAREWVRAMRARCEGAAEEVQA